MVVNQWWRGISSFRMRAGRCFRAQVPEQDGSGMAAQDAEVQAAWLQPDRVGASGGHGGYISQRGVPVEGGGCLEGVREALMRVGVWSRRVPTITKPCAQQLVGTLRMDWCAFTASS